MVRELGELETVPTSPAPEADSNPAVAPTPTTNAPRLASGRVIDEAMLSVANAVRIEPVEGNFVAARGFRILDVPDGATFWRVGEDPPVWEIRDPSGRRLALISETEWSDAIMVGVGSEGSARPGSAGEPRYVEAWGREGARIVSEQFSSPVFVYRIERRADGSSDWIAGQWEPIIE